MFELLKIIHFLALLGGGAATIAPGLILRGYLRTGHLGPPPAASAMTLRALGIIGLISILLLWLTGIAMTSMIYGDAGLGLWFLIKLAGAAVILGASVFLNLAAARAARTGQPTDPKLMRAMVMAVRGALLVAIVAAVLAFG